MRKAVTDTDGEMRYDRAAKPGLANLLDLLAAATGRTPVEVAAGYERYGDLKNDVAAALCELLGPVRRAAGGARERPALRRRRARTRCGTRPRGRGSHVRPGGRRHGAAARYARLTPSTPVHQLKSRSNSHVMGPWGYRKKFRSTSPIRIGMVYCR